MSPCIKLTLAPNATLATLAGRNGSGSRSGGPSGSGSGRTSQEQGKEQERSDHFLESGSLSSSVPFAKGTLTSKRTSLLSTSRFKMFREYQARPISVMRHSNRSSSRCWKLKRKKQRHGILLHLPRIEKPHSSTRRASPAVQSF